MQNKVIKKSMIVLVSVFLTLGLSLSFQSLMAAWTPPTQAPPGGNVDSLLHVGTDNQAKAGFLMLGNSTESPVHQLHVRDSVGNAEINIQSGARNHWGIYHEESDEQLMFWNAGAGNALVIDDNGNVGVGIDIPGRKLDVAGSGRFTTLDTGNGSNELFAMNQNVRTTDSPTFVNLNSMRYIYGDFGTMMQSTDEWLRLNNDSSHTNGIYTPGLLRADGGFYVGGNKVATEDYVDSSASSGGVSYKACYDNDVYWYDSDDNRLAKDEECGGINITFGKQTLCKNYNASAYCSTCNINTENRIYQSNWAVWEASLLQTGTFPDYTNLVPTVAGLIHNGYLFWKGDFHPGAWGVNRYYSICRSNGYAQ